MYSSWLTIHTWNHSLASSKGWEIQELKYWDPEEMFFFSYGQNKEGGSKGRAYMYTYGLFMLRFDIKQQKSIKQLSFN